MDGNRGAKGSIKDRLISMLYRMRYKKKKLKEKDYTKENKEKQINYLNDLSEFKEKENIDILSKEDVKKLDKVEYKAIFNIDNKKSVDLTELKLDSIESKTEELDEKVDLKKEIKKTKEELEILKEVDTFVKKSLENISEIKVDIQEIKKESKIKNKDTKKLEEKYKVLKEKIEKLKLQYDVIKDRYDLSEFKIIESIKLIDAIDNYKNIASLNEIDMMLNVCKKEINKIDSITIINEEKEEIEKNIDNTKKDQKKIKIKFNKHKEKLSEISFIEKEIEEEILEQKRIVDDMYDKASFFEKNISKKIEVIGHREVLGSLFRIAGGILTLPFTGKQLFGIAFGSTLINRGLKEMNRRLETKEKIVVNYNYEDISKQIEQIKNKVEYTSLILTDSLNQVSKIRINFKDVYSEYSEILPEYNSTLKKLSDLEIRIKKQQEKLLKMDKKLDKEKEINKQKLKKVNEIHN